MTGRVHSLAGPENDFTNVVFAPDSAFNARIERLSISDFAHFKEREKVSAAMHNAFDSNCVFANAKEDDVVAYGCLTSIWTDLRSKWIELRLLGDLFEFRAERAEQTRRVARAIECDVLSDLAEVIRHVRR